MREVLTDLTRALDEGRDCVYCSVVETRGSTPQKAGAAMLVFADGSQRGTLGGGCVEAEVKQRALAVLADDGDQPELLTFCAGDTVKATEANLLKFLRKSPQFVIPIYQRNYSWTADECLLRHCRSAFRRLELLRREHRIGRGWDATPRKFLRHLRRFLGRTGYLHR